MTKRFGKIQPLANKHLVALAALDAGESYPVIGARVNADPYSMLARLERGGYVSKPGYKGRYRLTRKARKELDLSQVVLTPVVKDGLNDIHHDILGMLPATKSLVLTTIKDTWDITMTSARNEWARVEYLRLVRQSTPTKYERTPKGDRALSSAGYIPPEEAEKPSAFAIDETTLTILAGVKQNMLPRHIAFYVDLAPKKMTEAIRNLNQQGYIERASEGYILTDKGLSLQPHLPTIAEELSDLHRDILSHLPAPQIQIQEELEITSHQFDRAWELIIFKELVERGEQAVYHLTELGEKELLGSDSDSLPDDDTRSDFDQPIEWPDLPPGYELTEQHHCDGRSTYWLTAYSITFRFPTEVEARLLANQTARLGSRFTIGGKPADVSRKARYCLNRNRQLFIKMADRFQAVRVITNKQEKTNDVAKMLL